MPRPPELYLSPIVPSKAITVVVHGLNNRPMAMKALSDFLCAAGSDVVLVSLSGHSEHEQMQQVSREIWHNDLLQAYRYAASLLKKSHARPLYFLGYSLGALINLDLMTELPEVIRYDKMVLLAPANVLRRRVQLLQQLSARLLHRSWQIPSLMPQLYRAGKFTPVQAYRVLFEMGACIERKAYNGLHIPTLIIIDPQDEMISLIKLKKMIARFNLKAWQIYLLQGRSETKPAYHHLILDESSAGKDRWHAMKAQIGIFFQLNP